MSDADYEAKRKLLQLAAMLFGDESRRFLLSIKHEGAVAVDLLPVVDKFLENASSDLSKENFQRMKDCFLLVIQASELADVILSEAKSLGRNRRLSGDTLGASGENAER